MAKSWVWGAAFSLLLTSTAAAQDELGEEPSEFGNPEAGDTNNPEAMETVDANPTMEGSVADPNADQWLLGLQWRQWILPSFIQTLLVDEAPTVFQPSFQLVATKRNSENFSLVFGLGYTSFAVEGLYRAKGDPAEDTEFVESDLKFLHGTFSALWAANINPYLDFEYGIGGELGVLLGEVRRTEAQNVNGTWSKCPGPLVNSPYCVFPQGGGATNAYDEDGEHYNVVEERIPPVFLFPILFQMGLRITPIPELAIKVEAAYGTIAFWFGASVHVNLSALSKPKARDIEASETTETPDAPASAAPAESDMPDESGDY